MTTTPLTLKKEQQEFRHPRLKNALAEYTARRDTRYTFTIYHDGAWWYEPCLRPLCGRSCGSCAGVGIVRLASSRTGAVRILARRTASPYDWRTHHDARTALYRWIDAHPTLAYDLARVRTDGANGPPLLKRLALIAGRFPLTGAQADLATRLLRDTTAAALP